jgi:glyoxylase-like metal-dependent hydrolase (beta-lactamase superfamily II)
MRYGKKKNKIKRCQEIYPGIYRITLPIPVDNPGPINVYLFRGKKTTLLDTGILQTAGLLAKALKEIGLSFSDIDQIIITHGHIDHYGAAMKIVQASGRKVKIAVHPEDADRLAYGREVPVKIYFKFLRLMGIPIHFRLMSWFILVIFNLLSKKCRADLSLQDGDIIQMGDYQGTVIGTPGHSQGSICIYLKKENILFSGDHILPHITPNAFVMLDEASPVPERLSQQEFYNSLEKIEALHPDTIYPAHSEPIHDLKKITDMYRDYFSLRQGLIISIMNEGDQTVYQIGRKLFPDISGIQLPLEIFLSISEVYTHLQILMKEDRVSIVQKGDRFIFTLVH